MVSTSTGGFLLSKGTGHPVVLAGPAGGREVRRNPAEQAGLFPYFPVSQRLAVHKTRPSVPLWDLDVVLGGEIPL